MTLALEDTRSPVRRPAGFDDFWQQTEAALADVPLEWERVPDATWTSESLQVDWLRFPSLGHEALYGWLAVPRGGAPSGNPGYLWLPGYSWGNPPPAAESLYPSTITLGLNLHGNPPDTPYVHPVRLGRDYITQGIGSPQTYIYRNIVAGCLRALDVLAAQPEVDPARLVVGGMSQGGGLALVTAARAPRVRLCCADMPWLCDLDRALSLIDRTRYAHLPNFRIPDSRVLIQEYADAHPEQREAVLETFRYFDPLSHAGRIACPVQMSAGGRDPSCRPATIYAVFNEIRTEKEMLYLPQAGHEILPVMHVAHENGFKKWVHSP